MLLTCERDTDKLSSPHVRSVVVFFLKPGMKASLKQMFTQVPNTVLKNNKIEHPAEQNVSFIIIIF